MKFSHSFLRNIQHNWGLPISKDILRMYSGEQWEEAQNIFAFSSTYAANYSHIAKLDIQGLLSQNNSVDFCGMLKIRKFAPSFNYMYNAHCAMNTCSIKIMKFRQTLIHWARKDSLFTSMPLINDNMKMVMSEQFKTSVHANVKKLTKASIAATRHTHRKTVQTPLSHYVVQKSTKE